MRTREVQLKGWVIRMHKWNWKWVERKEMDRSGICLLYNAEDGLRFDLYEIYGRFNYRTSINPSADVQSWL